jgi:hypothetical protein
VETAKSQPASVIEKQQLAQLPVLSRQFLVLAQLMPSAAPIANLGVYARFVTTKFGGTADQRNAYTTIIDGATIDDATWGSPVINLTQDSVQEFKVYRNQFDAEYGFAQNAVINVATRSGGDRFAGTGYYFGRDAALDAQNALASSTPPFRQLRAGGTIGGPLLSKNTHFFAGYENLNVSTALIEALPPSNPFAAQENGNYPFTITENEFDLRVDHRFNNANTLFVRYAYDNQYTPTGGPVNGANTQIDNSHSHSIVAEHNWVLSQDKVNTLRFSYLHHNLFTLPSNNNITVIRPSFSFGQNDVDPQYFPRDDESVADTFFISRPKHDIKFGGVFTHALSNYQAHYYERGEFDFSTDAPFNPNDSSTWPYAFIQQTPGNFHYPSNQITTFVQDDWKVHERVRLNLGLRWDLDTNLRDNGFYEGLLSNSQLNGIQSFVSRSRGNEWTNLQPRLGVAWNVLGNGTFVIHAGAGYYVTRNRPWLQEQGRQQTIGASVYITDPNALRNYPNITAVLGGKSLSDFVNSGGPRFAYIISNNFRLPWSKNATAGFEWQITKKSSVTGDLVYDRTGDEYSTIDLNQPQGPITATNVRPVPQFSQVLTVGNNGRSWYKALELQYRGTVKGLDALQVSYTYSRSTLDGVVDYWLYPFENSHAFNPTDTPHNFSIAWSTVPLPGKVELSGVFRAISGGPLPDYAGIDLNGDQITGNDLPAGLPQTVGRGNVSQQLQTINAYRANPCTFVYYSVVPCSAQPLAPISADALKIYNVIDLDLRLTKSIHFGERRRLDLFFEGYNVTNHVTKFGGNQNINSAAFLVPTTALDPRQLQWGVRFVF